VRANAARELRNNVALVSAYAGANPSSCRFPLRSWTTTSLSKPGIVLHHRHHPFREQAHVELGLVR
jgi:hypothetical protein